MLYFSSKKSNRGISPAVWHGPPPPPIDVVGGKSCKERRTCHEERRQGTKSKPNACRWGLTVKVLVGKSWRVQKLRQSLMAHHATSFLLGKGLNNKGGSLIRKCSCHGNAGFCHLSCMIEYAQQMSKQVGGGHCICGHLNCAEAANNLSSAFITPGGGAQTASNR